VAQLQTLKNPVSFSGAGLHSGNRVNMTFLPAPSGAGLCFRRVDLDGRPEVEARVENVIETTRSTTIGKGSIRIHTTEHVLAALSGCGIDDAIIELDSNEPPIGDGSAREYVKMIHSAGIIPQTEPREPFRIPEPIHLEMGESMISVVPCDTFRISCTSADKRGRFTQFFSTDVTPKTWELDLAHARTFCFFEEIEYLIKNGLIKGGSLENAVIIRDDAVLTTEPLRYPEEFVRHKMLDIIGDLALIGRPILGHVVAIRPGHAANCALARRIVDLMNKPLVAAQMFSPPPSPVETSPASSEGRTNSEMIADGAQLDIMQIMKILPHRYPFLMVDRIIKIDGNKITGLKNVTINEPFFPGHYPNHPIMPGVLQVEAIAQVAGILMLKRIENAGKLAYFMSAEEVKWRKPVRPGDVLQIDVELLKMRSKIGRARGVCKVGDVVVSEAEVTFMLADKS
jgi:UDP-3-O-[3-hydroxymyristoyl] N-acetylglucosamine deacetylase/3-hydroxyacyl-[acyl-carrier-protein] dehydratase